MLAGCLWAGLMATAAQGLGVTRHISSADGLSNDFVVAQSIDGMGYLWVGTESGVNRIAGNTCRPMFAEQLEGSLITALHWHAATGHMLIGATTAPVSTSSAAALMTSDSWAIPTPGSASLLPVR